MPVMSGEIEDTAVHERIEHELGYPVFIKPSNAGSSRGVSKAANRQELVSGLSFQLPSCICSGVSVRTQWPSFVIPTA